MVQAEIIKKLDLFKLPLTGRVLIEASAGTGKTYSLAFIYLRLLLGIGEQAFPRPLDVSNILVVTFTKAATQELRFRIRQNIHELLLGLTSGKHTDPMYQQLIDLIVDKNQAIEKLIQAKQSMDEASIYTIHSFCQRILQNYAFESGALFNQTLLISEYQTQLLVVQDFWRHFFSPLAKELVYIILQSWQQPEDLLADVMKYLHQDLKCIANSSYDILDKITDFYQKNIQIINDIKVNWLADVEYINQIIIQSGVSKQSYSSRNLPIWLTKVSHWANQPTLNFQLPQELQKFRQATLIEKTKEGKQIPEHKLFNKIEALYATNLDLASHLLPDIAYLIKKGIEQEKLKQGEIGFDDLIIQLKDALMGEQGKLLSQHIADNYPVAMIDEFQDTDPIQYQIFDRIYPQHSHAKTTGLVFIGDPKQAIYSFRGADIFTYLQAKQSVADNHFTMESNWRSSKEMVFAINQLFDYPEQPFIFNEIPFLKMDAVTSNHCKAFIVNHTEQPALSGHLLPINITTVTEYQDLMATYCAQQISQWLSGSGRLKISPVDYKTVTSADIAILVRTGHEAELIQNKLFEYGIKSVYLSDHKSVFLSKQAKDILSLLNAVLMPEEENYLHLALMTNIIGLSMSELEKIIHDQDEWEAVIEEFKQYQMIWQHYGVLVMLRRMMKKRHLAENILAHADGERVLTNLMHLGELLQEAADDLESPHALVRWLTKQITNPDYNATNHEQRLESDDNLVKIITIHKAKGLEFPLVWLPFIAKYRENDSYFFHDKDNHYQLTYAWQLSEEVKQKIEAERLAEDLRLCYVALTRSIYHCSLGLAMLKKNNSAINYLLKGDVNALANIADIKHIELPLNKEAFCRGLTIEQGENSSLLSANTFNRKFTHNWQVTSYTGLQKQGNSSYLFLDIDNKWQEHQDLQLTPQITEMQYDIHHFPKGAQVGSLFHHMMENITEVSHEVLSASICQKLNLSESWFAVLNEWIRQLLSTSFIAPEGRLLDVLQGNCIKELQFYLPIEQSITAEQLDSLCKKYDSLSRICPKLDFLTIEGLLKGFIDLVFEWQGKFYIVDYKSNWLGDSVECYQQEAIQAVMCEHRYDLQYQLYSLALHRFLKNRLPNYQYQRHFGGVYYLFLRGMPQNGIFYHLPNEDFIHQLDQLFTGNYS